MVEVAPGLLAPVGVEHARVLAVEIRIGDARRRGHVDVAVDQSRDEKPAAAVDHAGGFTHCRPPGPDRADAPVLEEHERVAERRLPLGRHNRDSLDENGWHGRLRQGR
jgi:hypothetical protein